MSSPLKTNFFRKGNNYSLYSPSIIYRGFRDRVFALSWFKSFDTHLDRVVAFIFECGSDAGDACYSLINTAGGEATSAALYYSDGGGIIGSGQHLDVVKISQELINYSDKFIPFFDKRYDYPLPSPAMVRFYVIKYSNSSKNMGGKGLSVYSVEYPEDEVSMEGHELHLLFLKSRELISLIESKVLNLIG